jgi:DinB family protein
VSGLRSMGRRWRELFEPVPDEALRRRPAPEVWSPLEYAAHTRDILALFAAGLPGVLAGHRPAYPAVEPDPPGHDRGYNTLDPQTVLGELTANADRLADEAQAAGPGQWERTATIGDNTRDAAWLLFHALHDASHHLRDVAKQVSPA